MSTTVEPIAEVRGAAGTHPDAVKAPSTRGYFRAGAWHSAPAGTFDDINPYSGEVYAQVARCGREEAALAVTDAEAAFPSWSSTTPAERVRLLRNAAAVVERRKDELVAVLAHETGATTFNAQFQMDRVVQLIHQITGWAYLPAGEIVPSDIPGAYSLVERRPLGVVACFTPWNGAAILTWRAVLTPVIAGNTVVVKPTELAPLSAGLLVAEILQEAGFPAGVVNVVTHGPGEAGPIADEFFERPEVRCINFIGSVPTGRMLAGRAGATLKRSVMELGGYNPLLVLDDVDLDYAVRVATFSAFFHQGQICMNARKVFVHRNIYEEFVERLVERAAALPQGDPQDPATFIGPLITPDAVRKVQERVDEAVALGARVLTGGRSTGPVYEPTVLVDVPDNATVSIEETFGPVVIVQAVDSAEEAIAAANKPLYGLTAAILSGDTHRALTLSRQLRAGAIHVNMSTVHDEIQTPIGGVRDSGWGRTGPHALHDFTDIIATTVQTGEQDLPLS